jgi:hypothetical protein
VRFEIFTAVTIDPSLGSDLEENKETILAARQQIIKKKVYATVTG